jgi:hypothetical protein
MDVWQQSPSKKFVIREEVQAKTHHRENISENVKSKGSLPYMQSCCIVVCLKGLVLLDFRSQPFEGFPQKIM